MTHGSYEQRGYSRQMQIRKVSTKSCILSLGIQYLDVTLNLGELKAQKEDGVDGVTTPKDAVTPPYPRNFIVVDSGGELITYKSHFYTQHITQENSN